MPDLKGLYDIRGTANRMRSHDLRVVASTTPEDVEKFVGNGKELLDTMSQLRADYEKGLSDPHERELWNQYLADWQKYLDIRERGIAAARQRKPTEAAEAIYTEGLTAFDQALVSLGADIKLNSEGALAESVAAKAAYHKGLV